MNTTIKPDNTDSTQHYEKLKNECGRSIAANRIALRMLELVKDNMSPDLAMVVGECGVSFWVSTRENLASMMIVAKRWEKTPGISFLLHTATVDGVSVTLYARDGARGDPAPNFPAAG